MKLLDKLSQEEGKYSLISDCASIASKILLITVLLVAGSCTTTIVNAAVSEGDVQRAEQEYQRKEDIRNVVREIFPRYNLNPNLGIALIHRESDYQPYAVGGKYSKCVGLTQVSTKWQAPVAVKYDITDWYNTWNNVTICAEYLTELFEKYEDPALVLMVYRYGDEKGLNYYTMCTWDPEGYAQTILEEARELDIYEEAIINGTAKG